MQVQLKVAPNVIVTAEGEKETEVFEQLASLQEVFGQATKCGKCGGTNIRLVVRQNKDEDKFYEMRCMDLKCRAVLAFGCHKKPAGGLFPKKKGEPNADGKATWLPHDGWQVYNPQTKQKE